MTTESFIDDEIMEMSIALGITIIFIFNVLNSERIGNGDYILNEIDNIFCKPFIDIIIPCPDDPGDILNKFIYQLNGSEKQTQGHQIVNGFGVSHMILFGCLSFLYPSKRSLLFSIGVIWEIYESIFLHNNNMDLFFNLFGILAASI
jgi:hypothetical protein